MMKGLLTYYGGKQKLAPTIVELIPLHVLYAEPFAGGAVVFFNKRPSQVEVLNDSNSELMNFYKVVKENYAALIREVEVTLHSRRQHQQAWIIYNNPDLFDEVKRAWAVWVLSMQSFSSRLDGSFGFDITDNTTSTKIRNNIIEFSSLYAKRLEKVQLENADALYIIRSRDSEGSFFYCDPPYYNSDMGHYRGYTKQDFHQLLNTIAAIKGKFLLSSYPSKMLDDYVIRYKWEQKIFEQTVSVNLKSGKLKAKTEVLTANYPLVKNENQMTMF